MRAALPGDGAAALTARPEGPEPNLTISLCAPPGGTGEKDRAPISHESFLLMANSQTDMDDWVKAIRRVIWAPFGGGRLAAVAGARRFFLLHGQPRGGGGNWWLILTLVCRLSLSKWCS